MLEQAGIAWSPKLPSSNGGEGGLNSALVVLGSSLISAWVIIHPPYPHVCCLCVT